MAEFGNLSVDTELLLFKTYDGGIEYFGGEFVSGHLRCGVFLSDLILAYGIQPSGRCDAHRSDQTRRHSYRAARGGVAASRTEGKPYLLIRLFILRIPGADCQVRPRHEGALPS